MSYRCPAVVPKLVHDIANVMLHSTTPKRQCEP
jgi:hypothetical protein